MNNNGGGVTITRDEFNKMLSAISSVLSAMGKGELRITEDTQTARQPVQVRPVTIKEQRAMAIAADHQRHGDGAAALSHKTPKRKTGRRKGAATGPRVQYELLPGKLNLEGLPPAAVRIARYLSMHESAPVQTLMSDIKLERSTVMNTLKVLRDRGIAKSVPVQEAAGR